MTAVLAPPTWRDNRRFVRIVAGGWLALSVLGAVVSLNHSSDVADDLRRQSDGTTFVSVNITSNWGTGLGALVSLGALVLVVVATWRLAKAHALLGRPETTWGPGWAVAGRVIPLANIVLPFLQLDELWRGSAPATPRDATGWRRNHGTKVAGAAIGLGIAGAILGLIGGIKIFRSLFSSIDEFLDGSTNNALADAIDAARPWTIAAAVVNIVVGASAVYMLVRIADRQQHLHEVDPRPYVDPTAAQHPWQATFPAGWYVDPYGRYAMRWWDGATWTPQVYVDGASSFDPSGAMPPPPQD